MRVSPRPLVPVASEWADFQGVIPIDLRQMESIFPGFNAAAEITLTVPVAPLLGHMQFSELAVLIAVVRTLGASSFAEIGTFDGLTVLNLLENCPQLQKIYTVDLPEDVLSAKGTGSVFPIDSINASMLHTVRIGARFANHPLRGKVVQLREDSANLTERDFPTSPEVFLIDGAHTWEYCLSDSRLAQKVTADSSVLVWHDYANVKYLPGVTEVLQGLAREQELRLYWLDSPPLRTSLVFGIRDAA
ncbi:MAG TPA: class I SAM-dependent methyltransferase [Bryobacteraceae bacterium]|nr:class I SAM-dependent methyltransferase [Bryobacteraceae bacterium]